MIIESLNFYNNNNLVIFIYSFVVDGKETKLIQLMSQI